MLGDGLPNSGTQGSYFKYQYGVLKLLEQIAAAVAVIGPDNETRTTRYEVTGGPTPPGAGYSIGDFLVRYDIIDTVTSTIVSTIWFNQTTQTTLVGAGNPNPVDIVPAAASLSVTVLNPFNLEATQLLIQALLTTIDGDTSNLDVLLSTRNAEATQLLIHALLTTIDIDTSNLDVLLSTRNAEATQLLIHALLTAIDIDTSAIAVSVASMDGKMNLDYGISSGAIRTASQIGNTTGQADFNAGAPGAQTLRVVIANPDIVTPQVVTSTLNPAGAGSVAAGASSVGFTTDLLFAGSINGVARNSSTFYGFEAAPGKTLPAIPWVVGAGNVIIDVIA